ncbi:MAG TPA: ribonuclease D, partial [Chloroflexi bacterium]|nr:ribonuclease D [Chloroflexota bacterium]
MSSHPTQRSRKNPPDLPPPLLVATPDELTRLQRDLADISRIAIDTESNSLFAYREQVCLIQLSTDRQDYVIDPLFLRDQSGFGFLGELFASPQIEKVFHAAEYDVMSLRRDFGFTFTNLFDTMIAARLLGWEHLGLGSILEERFGVTVNKRYQRADWGRRPLPPHLIRYAQLDTHYLLPLRDELYDLLKGKGQLEEARELFDEVSEARWNRALFDPLGFWRIKGAHALDQSGIAVLQELYLYREQQARRRDLPVFKVMGDQTLLKLAERRPPSLREMRRIPGLTEGQIQRYGVGILRAIRRGLTAPPPPPPARNGQHPGQAVLRRFDALHAWRKER